MRKNKRKLQRAGTLNKYINDCRCYKEEDEGDPTYLTHGINPFKNPMNNLDLEFDSKLLRSWNAKFDEVLNQNEEQKKRIELDSTTIFL